MQNSVRIKQKTILLNIEAWNIDNNKIKMKFWNSVHCYRSGRKWFVIWAQIIGDLFF